MEHISKMINQDRQQTESELQTSGFLTDKHIALLWIRMGKIYGHKWESSYGESDDGSWQKGLHGITPEQVGRGLERLLISGEEWPPSLPEFRKLCEGKKTNEYGLDHVPQYYRGDKPTNAKQLGTDRTGHMTASKETVDNSIQSLRASLRGHH